MLEEVINTYTGDIELLDRTSQTKEVAVTIISSMVTNHCSPTCSLATSIISQPTKAPFPCTYLHLMEQPSSLDMLVRIIRGDRGRLGL